GGRRVPQRHAERRAALVHAGRLARARSTRGSRCTARGRPGARGRALPALLPPAAQPHRHARRVPPLRERDVRPVVRRRRGTAAGALLLRRVSACAGAARVPPAQARNHTYFLGELPDRGADLRQLVLELRELRVVGALELAAQVTLAETQQELLRGLFVDAVALGDGVQLREDRNERLVGRLLVHE